MIKSLFNNGWFFSKQTLETSLEEMHRENVQWEAVQIPHDWLIYDTNKLYETGKGWYRKEFEINSLNQKEEYISLRFEGVYMDTIVYLNNEIVGEWKCGYSTFEFNVTDFLIEGKNEIILQVTYQSPNTRWYSGAGIYRNIWINRKKKNRIISDGTYITQTKELGDKWRVEIDTELFLENNHSTILRHLIYNSKGEVINQIQNDTTLSGFFKDYQSMDVFSPLLWDIGQGNLYVLRSELYENEVLIDAVENRIGFREIETSPNDGFKINGRHEKIFGVCQHHDLGALGAAVNKVALRRQLEILREMGVNAVRTSHNMPAVELMELADEMGILICSESFDMWEGKKTTYDYARFFKEWVELDVASWIRRDRNCPSVIMWCIGNEIYDTHASDRGQELTKMLKELVEQHDPKQHAPVTLGSNYMPWENARKCADIVKLAGYNYADKYYEAHHKEHPDWIIYGSETASTVQSRGVYRFPLKQSILSDDDEQCSSLGNSSTSWGAKSTEACIVADRDAKFSLGQFIWTGFDYIGEPTPYHTKNSYFGQIDTAGFKKDAFYIYQAEWTSYKTNPMIHIFPYWDFSLNQLIDIRVCSNAPKIELFFNDNSLGTFEIDHKNGKKLVGDWQLPYELGTLRAIAYNEEGEIIAEDVQSSFGDAHKLVLSPDKTEIKVDGEDLVFIEISTVDENGVEVANANNRVRVNVTGAGRLIGLDNGDSTDYDQYKETSRRLFSGKLLAIIAANDLPGDINIDVESIGLKSQKLVIKAVEADFPKGRAKVFSKNTESPINNEIPVRKIELLNEVCHLTKEKSIVEVEAIIYPANASYEALEWRVTDAAGIDSNIVNLRILDENSRKVEITALGDGEFYLRCMTRNGSDKVKLISQLNFSITGLGAAHLNPYEFISGGLYNASNIELTNGNERGVASDRELKSYIGFKGVDFGEYGADTITLPIFSLSPEELPIEIWEGMPGEEGSECLGIYPYTLGSQWNTYLEEVYTLPRKLKGLTTICFGFDRKVHLKGFQFAKPEKAYDKLSVKEYNSISGDSFLIKENTIEGIGNNVTIQFNEMDFSTKGLKKIQICGQTPLEKNTIRIQFNDEISQLVEFKHSKDYEVQEFELETLSENGTVSFIFLPGCQFNFKWFQFIN